MRFPEIVQGVSSIVFVWDHRRRATVRGSDRCARRGCCAASPSGRIHSPLQASRELMTHPKVSSPPKIRTILDQIAPSDGKRRRRESSAIPSVERGTQQIGVKIPGDQTLAKLA